MDGRGLKQISQLPAARRLEVIAEGLSLIAENVRSLRDDIQYLYDGARPRTAEMITGQADEEAAKVLILLDLIRSGVSNTEIVKLQTTQFYEHLPRCIYAEMAHMHPASFAEAKSLVDLERKSHFLDGPNDVDWIFRNQLMSQREQRLYVDYVVEEDGARWVSPARFDRVNFGPLTAVPNLVLALERTRCTSLAGLKICAEEWDGVVIDSATHWQTVAQLNRRILARLGDQEPHFSTATADDRRRVVDSWGFPLTSVDLTMDAVARTNLLAERARVEADL